MYMTVPLKSLISRIAVCSVNASGIGSKIET